MQRDDFNYDPQTLPRELKKYYISASENDLKDMLQTIGMESLEDLYQNLPDAVRFSEFQVTEEFDYQKLAQHVYELSQKNILKPSFLGAGLQQYQVPEIVPFVCSIRGLTTAYTPYQPERSQGTLQSLWIYQSLISQLTGFEAINASLYERSTCLFEALNCALRLTRKTKVLICESLYERDREVLQTLAEHTAMKLITVAQDSQTGTTCLASLDRILKEEAGQLAGLAFPQVNRFGLLEDVHTLSDYCQKHNLKSIAVIDPVLIATGGLVPPSAYDASMIVAEAQHLGLKPNFGGPGLGIFGIRYNESDRTSIRSTAGRYVGKAEDESGRPCKVLILSTREQHIRREKATSNICSNQSFIATVVGASLLQQGEGGLKTACEVGFKRARLMATKLTCFEGVDLAFPKTPFANELALALPVAAEKLIAAATDFGLHLGLNISSEQQSRVLISFSNWQSDEDLQQLEEFFRQQFAETSKPQRLPVIESRYLRAAPVNLPTFSLKQLKEYYTQLGEQNLSPDDNLYPLGSCTMKYNPYLNDYAAGLKGFTDLHPEAPLSDSQGSLEILYHIQEMFKDITGLPAVTTQPVAGAQGELVGLKLFQAYFQDRGEKRDVILIPRSAHGTNPATATMAGFETKMVDGKKVGILTLEANAQGMVDKAQVETLIAEYDSRIAGIMVTNPNTAGIFEQDFHHIAKLIHQVGGLVYMDGANMNAIAGWVDLQKLGVDAVHNNLHKTWTIPHGGGGPGDAIVAVSEKLKDYLPGLQITKTDSGFGVQRPAKSIGSFHRHWGNFAHKVRCYTYLKALGSEGIRKMAAVAVLSSRYLLHKLAPHFPTLPTQTEKVPRLHEFILTLTPELFYRIEVAGTKKAQAIARVGKLFLDFGIHAPTVAFPEVYGLMIEPTESFSKAELDRFVEVVMAILGLLQDSPEVLQTVPHFTPLNRVNELQANKTPILSEVIEKLPQLYWPTYSSKELEQFGITDICQKILEAHQGRA